MRNNTPKNARKGTPATRADDRRLAVNSPVNRRARGLAPLAPKNAATVAAPVTPALAGPRIEFVFASAGRPSAEQVAMVATAFDLLNEWATRATPPKGTHVPKNAPKGVRAAYAAHDALATGADSLLRTAIANGRARSNGR